MSKPLKIVMIARPNLFKVPGGDTVQLKETANALRMLDVEVDIHLEGDINYEKYQLIHFFNVITPEDILGHIIRPNCHTLFLLFTLTTVSMINSIERISLAN